ncbi:esterase, partial [Oryctes borbonicus]
MGQSAGATCVEYLGMLPQLKGKISGIIQQSGSAISSFSLGRYRRLGAYVLSTSLGLQSQNSSAILEYLRTVDPEELRKRALTTSVDVLYGTGAFHGLLYIPGLESRSNKNSLLTEMTYEQLKGGNFNKIRRLMG